MERIPAEAKAVVAEIRKHVKRPDYRRFHSPDECGVNMIMERRASDKTWHNEVFCCPMGLLPYASNDHPSISSDLRGSGLSNENIFFFWKWWDRIPQSDRKKAVDAVWGKKK